jgi:hypothetical protein
LLTPERRKAIVDYIGLLGALIGIIDLLRRILSGPSQYDELRSFILLVVLAIFILLELSQSSPYLFVPLRYAVPLVLLCLGVSLSFRSANEIVSILLGGVVAFLALFLVDRCWRALRKQQGFDQGTLLAAFIAGLYVHVDRVFGMLYVMVLLASIFYIAFFLIRRVPLTQNHIVPIIPFLVLAVIVTTTPYYTAVEIAYKNIGSGERISAIQQFIEHAKNGETASSLPTGNDFEIAVSYNKDAVPLQRMAERYRDTKPRLVYQFWESSLETWKHKGPQAIYAYHDLNTGYVFLVSQINKVIEKPAAEPGNANK